MAGFAVNYRINEVTYYDRIYRHKTCIIKFLAIFGRKNGWIKIEKMVIQIQNFLLHCNLERTWQLCTFCLNNVILRITLVIDRLKNKQTCPTSFLLLGTLGCTSIIPWPSPSIQSCGCFYVKYLFWMSVQIFKYFENVAIKWWEDCFILPSLIIDGRQGTHFSMFQRVIKMEEIHLLTQLLGSRYVYIVNTTIFLCTLKPFQQDARTVHRQAPEFFFFFDSELH